MKKTFSFVVVVLLCIITANAQTLPFQGVARDSNGVLIPNANMSVRISILDSTSTGTVVYQETQSVTTNNLGLFTLGIGSGTPVTGTFSAITWGSASKFVQLEVDPSGGIGYINMGTTQLQSVPYALYALNGAGGSQPENRWFTAPAAALPLITILNATPIAIKPPLPTMWVRRAVRN